MSEISLADVNLELQTTLPAGYTSAMIVSLSDTGENMVKVLTNRTTFTGSAADLYTRAVLCFVCSRLIASSPNISKSAIKSISEQGDSITFRGTSDSEISAYMAEFNKIVNALRIKSHSYSTYTCTNTTTFYTEDS